jgi:hypothetical protein
MRLSVPPRILRAVVLLALHVFCECKPWGRLDNVGFEGVVIDTDVTGREVRARKCQQACEALPSCAGFAFNGTCAPFLAKSWLISGERLGNSVFLKPNVASGTSDRSSPGVEDAMVNAALATNATQALNIMYYRTPKCGSSTFGGILFRIAAHHGLMSGSGHHKSYGSESFGVGAKHRVAKFTDDWGAITTRPRKALWEPPVHDAPLVDVVRPELQGGLPDAFVASAFKVAMIRNPATRALSELYYFPVTQDGLPDTDENQIFALEGSRGEYRRSFGLHTGHDWHNGTSGKVMGQFDWIGVTELFDQSIVLLLLQMQTRVPAVNMGDFLYVAAKIAQGGEMTQNGRPTAKHPKLAQASAAVQAHVKQLFESTRGMGWDARMHQAATLQVRQQMDDAGPRFNTALSLFQCYNAAASSFCVDPRLMDTAFKHSHENVGHLAPCYYGDNGCFFPCLDLFWAQWQSRETELCGSTPDGTVNPKLAPELRAHGTLATKAVLGRFQHNEAAFLAQALKPDRASKHRYEYTLKDFHQRCTGEIDELRESRGRLREVHSQEIINWTFGLAETRMTSPTCLRAGVLQWYGTLQTSDPASLAAIQVLLARLSEGPGTGCGDACPAHMASHILLEHQPLGSSFGAGACSSQGSSKEQAEECTGCVSCHLKYWASRYDEAFWSSAYRAYRKP